MKFLYLFLTLASTLSFAQPDSTVLQAEGIESLQLPYNIKFTLLSQVWVRYTDVNPGSTVSGDPVDQLLDIGLRRTRLTMSGSPSEKTYVYVQYGINNFNNLTERKADFFFHDVIGEYKFSPGKFEMGAGLTGWNGLSRFSSPSIGSLMGIDAPLFAQSTNDATDQFLRKLSVYGKGVIKKVGYRMIVSSPMDIAQSSQNRDYSEVSTFSKKAPKPQYHGYVSYSFKETEKVNSPYTKGAYLGEKKVFNVGAGFLFQNEAMAHLESSGDTTFTPLALFAADLFYDAPIGTKNAALSLYSAIYSYNYGPDYLRNVGAMNPANGIDANGSINGPGSAVPIIGTGNIFYTQLGYLLPSDRKERIMPYGVITYGDYQALEDPMLLYDLGINLLLVGHKAKATLSFQNRPIFSADDAKVSERKSLVILQYQVTL